MLVTTLSIISLALIAAIAYCVCVIVKQKAALHIKESQIVFWKKQYEAENKKAVDAFNRLLSYKSIFNVLKKKVESMSEQTKEKLNLKNKKP